MSIQNLINKLQKRERIIWTSNSNNISNFAQARSENTESGTFLEMSIIVDKESPIQQDLGFTWNEIIAKGCFDDSISNDQISCFVDHDIKIEKMLGSTADGSMKISIEKSGYKALVKLDPTDVLCKKIINVVGNGLAKSNSFIFIPDEVEYIENQNSNGENVPDLTIIHRKAKLISIDPVSMAFYPFDEMKIINNELVEERNLNNFMKKTEKLKLLNELETASESRKKEIIALLRSAEETEAETAQDESVDNAETKESEKVEVEVDDESEDDDSENENENVDTEIDESDESKKIDESKEDSQEIQDSEKKPNIIQDQENPDVEQDYIDEKREGSNPPEKNITEKSAREQHLSSIAKRQKNNETNNLSIKELKMPKTLRELEKQYNIESRNTNGLSDSFKNEIKERFANYGDIEKEINLVSQGAYQRAIDGSALNQGLAYVSYINDPEVKTELEKVIPELTGAEIINLENLDVVKKDLLIPSTGAGQSVAEGASSISDSGTTITVDLKPTRYSYEIKVNPALANATQILEKQTLATKNKIVSKIRKDFVDSLLKHKAAQLSTLVAANQYTGGITKDALVKLAKDGELSYTDLDNLIDGVNATYGINAKDEFVFYANEKTWTYFVEKFNQSGTPAWGLIDRENYTYRGVKFILNPQYPDFIGDGKDANSIPVIFFRKDCIVARGLNFVTEDNPWIDMSKDLMTRYIKTRGEMKMFDPMLNTKALSGSGAVTFSRAELKQQDEFRKMFKKEFDKEPTDSELNAYILEKSKAQAE